MTVEKWHELVGKIKDSFEIQDEGREHLDEEGGVDIDYIEFTSPIGEIRLEMVTKPVILDKKTIYSNRIGSETKVDYVYSPTEKTLILFAYKYDEGQDEWVEIESNNFLK